VDYPKLTAIGTLAAVVVALGVAFIPIIASSVKNCRMRRFLKGQIHTYLCATRKNFERYQARKGKGLMASFEGHNRKNFDILEMLYRSSDVMRKKDQERIKTFVLFFKGTPNIGLRTDRQEKFKSELDETIDHFKPKGKEP